MKDDYKTIAMEWLKRADSDLAFAEASFKEFSNFYSQMCILCHDAVEKYLKAFISSQGVRPERIHDLLALLNECLRISRDIKGLKDWEEGLRILNRYYTPLKYPSHYPMMTKEQAREAIEIAEDIARFMKKQIRT